MKPTLRYSTILFDFDGTLTPSLPLWVRAFQFAFAQYGVSVTGADVVRRCFYRSWASVVDEFALPSLADFSAYVETGLVEAFDDAVLFEGVTGFLEECRLQDVKLGIVTSSKRILVERFLERYGLSAQFAAVVTADDIIYHKPHPGPILMALSTLASTSEGSMFVGDSAADMLAAGAAGMDKALFFPDEHHEFYDFDELTSHEPHLVFHDYHQLAASLSGL
jgi:pyrophosphatase PpaX